MTEYKMLAWPALIRPPLSNDTASAAQAALDVPLKALSCRNQSTSVMALVTADEAVRGARLVMSDLMCGDDRIAGADARIRLVGEVPTPEAGPVMDPLCDVEEFDFDQSAALHIKLPVPKAVAAGVYHGALSLRVGGAEVAAKNVEVEVADVDLPDVRDWSFFLNVWMNPATVARWHGVELWSDEHFKLMRPYVEDLAAHGQKTVVAPICYRPWGTQTRDPYPNSVIWKRRGGKFEFDFSIFDRYVELHEQCGIDRAIHCFSIAGWSQDLGGIQFEFIDEDLGETVIESAAIGSEGYVKVWSAFFEQFRIHLEAKGWLDRTYIAFDERPEDVMKQIVSFVERHAKGFKLALAGNTSDELSRKLDDLCVHVPFDEHGITRAVSSDRKAMGVAQLLDPDSRAGARHTITTFYVCCGPAFPNTFLFSPLVESRMMAFFSLQGGYDGFLRWSYNDWPDDPYAHPEWGAWPTGDIFFVYPGERGPVSSLRWEQLAEGIADYELAMIASANIQTPDEMVDYEQAVTLACRNTDGHTKAIGDIEIARRLLIPIAEHQKE